MQVIAAAAPAGRSQRVAVVRSAVAAVLLIAVGALLAWVCLATPLVATLTPTGRPSADKYALGIAVWAFALLVPATFLLLGLARVVGTIESLRSLRPRTVAPRLANVLGADHLAVTDLVLPGGRRINELILGPFGVAVLGAVPPPAISRYIGSRWEVRAARDRWVPIEAPVERAARDAERVRGWLTTDDRDFLVRVYAAVVTDDRRIRRTPDCAVVTQRELRSWIEGLPPQRGLTPARRDRLGELIRALVVGR